MDQEARLRRREEARRRTQQRRRLTAALALLAGAAGVVGVVVGAGDDSADRAGAGAEAERRPPPELPGGGRSILPEHRVVAFYGAPQDDELGTLGIGSPDQAGRRLARQARAYRPGGRAVMPAFELIATVASGAPGGDGDYSYRQPERVIRRYLDAARRADALLLLDIQPGHADFMAEARRFEKFLREPDVGLALDPEWHTPGSVPGSQIGSVSAKKVNQVSEWLGSIARARRLPEKLLVIHQFTSGMIEGRSRLRPPPGVALVVNVDGFGDRPNKIAKYREFTRARGRGAPGLKLFYREDTNMMQPRNVLRLRPRPEFVVYE
jgi:hypothetical protein